MNKYNYKFNNISFNYYLRDDIDFSVFTEVFKLLEYKSSVDAIKNAKDPIIDIGAHVGFFSIFTNCLNNDVKIYSIEPEKNNFELLNKHKEENKITNIKTFKCAIGKETRDGELIIKEDSINHKVKKLKIETSGRIQKSKKEEGIFQDIRIFSLKDFFNDNKIKKVSLIKMDIEGGEYDIIENLNVDDFSKIGAFVLEAHDSKTKNRKCLEEKLRENGFSVQVFPSKFDKDLGFIFAINKRIL